MTLEINTTRGIAAQILRHRSFTFQEFSQRYAETTLLSDKPEVPDLRRQDTKNRQNSIDDFGDYAKLGMQGEIQEYFQRGQVLYDSLLSRGVAKECARFVLPLAIPTRIYMTGSCRSWVHYIKLRSFNGTQKEHMEIAEGCKVIFSEQFNDVAKALEWV
jgi:thymidylate synthase (FAD)